MSKRLTSKERAVIVNKGLRIVWRSLSSHLPYAVTPGTEADWWEKKVVKEYLELMSLLGQLY